jgi:hypothetical protein
MERKYVIEKSIEDFFKLFYEFIQETADKLGIQNTDRNWLSGLKQIIDNHNFELPEDVIRLCTAEEKINELIYDVENLSKRFSYNNLNKTKNDIIKYKSQIETLCFLIYFYLSITTLLKKGYNLNSIKYSFVFRYNHLYNIITEFLNQIFQIFEIENYNYFRAFLLSSKGTPLFNVSFIKNDIINSLDFRGFEFEKKKEIEKFFHDCLQIDDFFILDLKKKNKNSIIISADKYRDNNGIECGEYDELFYNILPCVLVDKYNNLLSYPNFKVFKNHNNGFYLINNYQIPYKTYPNDFTNFFNYYDRISQGISEEKISSLPPETTNLQKSIESTSEQIMENIEQIDERIRGMVIDNSIIVLSYSKVPSFATDITPESFIPPKYIEDDPMGNVPLDIEDEPMERYPLDIEDDPRDTIRWYNEVVPMDIDGGKYYKKYLKYKTKYLKLKNNI